MLLPFAILTEVLGAIAIIAGWKGRVVSASCRPCAPLDDPSCSKPLRKSLIHFIRAEGLAAADDYGTKPWRMLTSRTPRHSPKIRTPLPHSFERAESWQPARGP